MEEQASQPRKGPRDTRPAGRFGARRIVLAISVVMIAAVVFGGAVSCGGREEAAQVTATVQPSPQADVITTPEAAITPEPTPPVEPTPGVDDEYEGWLTFTNDVYGYEFRFPPEAMIKEAAREEFHLSPEEVGAGITFDEVYERYTGWICVRVQYELGYIGITVPPNEDFRYVICGGTGRAYEGPDREETLVIDGRTYTAQGFEEQGPGETLNYHSERLAVSLDDGTRIEYGVGPADLAAYETATFEEYLQIRDQLLKIVQSYRKLP